MVSRSFNARDAFFAVYVTKGSEAGCDLVTESFCFRFRDNPIPLSPAEVESNESGAI
jgi:hypothetical protein